MLLSRPREGFFMSNPNTAAFGHHNAPAYVQYVAPAFCCRKQLCQKDLSEEEDYSKKHRVCRNHLKQPSVLVEGQPSRWCHQCAKFHSLDHFDEGKRTCRMRLKKLQARRHGKGEVTTDSEDDAADTDVATPPKGKRQGATSEGFDVGTGTPGCTSLPLVDAQAAQTAGTSRFITPRTSPMQHTVQVPADVRFNMPSPKLVDGTHQLGNLHMMHTAVGNDVSSSPVSGHHDMFAFSTQTDDLKLPLVKPDTLEPPQLCLYQHTAMPAFPAVGAAPQFSKVRHASTIADMCLDLPSWQDRPTIAPASKSGMCSQAKLQSWQPQYPAKQDTQYPSHGTQQAPNRQFTHHCTPAACDTSAPQFTPQHPEITNSSLVMTPQITRLQRQLQPLHGGTFSTSSSNSLAPRAGSFTSPVAHASPTPFSHSVLGRNSQPTMPLADVLPQENSHDLDLQLWDLLQDMWNETELEPAAGQPVPSKAAQHPSLISAKQGMHSDYSMRGGDYHHNPATMTALHHSCGLSLGSVGPHLTLPSHSSAAMTVPPACDLQMVDHTSSFMPWVASGIDFGDFDAMGRLPAAVSCVGMAIPSATHCLDAPANMHTPSTFIQPFW